MMAFGPFFLNFFLDFLLCPVDFKRKIPFDLTKFVCYAHFTILFVWLNVT